MEQHKLLVLHDHYRDSCSVAQSQRGARDRYFYFVVALMAVEWFDLVAPRDFGALSADLVKAQLHLTTAPDLAYLRGVLWFLLLVLTVRYCQTALAVERGYDYIHRIEALLAEEIHPAFNREGAGYLSDYPLFLNWAHVLYVWISPGLLMALVVTWMAAQLPSLKPWTWSRLVLFETAVGLGILATVVLYWAFHLGRSGEVKNKPAATAGRRSQLPRK
jgi:hypothetical protein